jgi:pentatricopeptide repeat protein
MIDEMHVRPNNFTMSFVLQAVVNSRTGFTMTEVAEWLDFFCRQWGLSPDKYTYGHLLLACKRKRDTGRAYQWFDELLRLKIAPSKSLRNIFSDTIGAEKFQEYWSAVRAATESNMETDRLLNSLKEGKGASMADLSRSLVGGGIMDELDLMMLGGGKGLGGDEDEQWSSIAYNAIIDAHAQNGNTTLAATLLEDMQKKGFNPDDITMNSVLTAFAQAGDREKAVYWLNKMRNEMGLNPDAATMTGIICSFCRYRDIKEAIAWLTRMVSEMGLRPNNTVMTAIVDAYAQSGDR